MDKHKAWHSGLVTKSSLCTYPGSHMGTGSCPGCSTSHPAPCLWLGKQLRIAQSLGTLHPHGRLGRGSWLLASDQLSQATVATWGVNRDRRSSSLSLLSVYLLFQ